MIASHKVRLKPNREQEKQFFAYANAARFVYNFSLSKKIEAYRLYGKSLDFVEIMGEIRNFKNDEGNDWLKLVPVSVQQRAVLDMLEAYKNFFHRGSVGFPKFKKKGKSRISFHQRSDRMIKVDNSHIKLTGIRNPVKVNEEIVSSGYMNPRVVYDGKYWYLVYSVEVGNENLVGKSGTLGVDLGIKNLAVVSNGKYFENVNKTSRVIKLEKRKKRLQRKLSNKYRKNRVGNKYVKTNNILKLEREIRLLDRRLKNIRETYCHEITSYLVKTKPERIVIEDLDVSNMIKNKYLSNSIQQCNFYKIRKQLGYKCEYYGIELIVVDRWFPSSKRCCKCGNINSNLKLSDRTYICSCGNSVDRDLNAALNLSMYA